MADGSSVHALRSLAADCRSSAAQMVDRHIAAELREMAGEFEQIAASHLPPAIRHAISR